MLILLKSKLPASPIPNVDNVTRCGAAGFAVGAGPASARVRNRGEVHLFLHLLSTLRSSLSRRRLDSPPTLLGTFLGPAVASGSEASACTRLGRSLPPLQVVQRGGDRAHATSICRLYGVVFAVSEASLHVQPTREGRAQNTTRSIVLLTVYSPKARTVRRVLYAAVPARVASCSAVSAPQACAPSVSGANRLHNVGKEAHLRRW